MAGVQLQYDENGAVRYFVDVPSGNVDYDGNAIYQRVEVPESSVKSEIVNVPYGEDGGGSYQQYTVPSDVYQKAVEAVTPPPVPKDYTRPQEITQSAVFQDVNSFSGGQLERIVDSINSGAYKVAPDKSALITPYGNFQLQSLGNGLYDIPIGARSGSYRVAIGINDKGEAVFNKNFLDNGAVRYQGGSPGGALGNFVRDIGPVGNIALAVATGGLSIPEQIAAQTAYNMVGGADLEDALKGAALNVALSEGVKASGLLGGDATKTSFAPEMGDELIPFDEGLTGIDIGDVIPATPAQLEGLYPVGGAFNPPNASTGGGELGENVPSGIDKWDEAFIRAGGIFNPEYVNASTGGMELGEGVPSGVAAWDKAYIDAGGKFLPGTTTDVVADYFNPDSTLTTPITLPSIKDLANAAVIAGTINSMVNPPSLGGGTTTGGGGFGIVPVPSDWKSPTYNQQFTPLDLNSLFTTANLLKGTQWENLPPEIKFAAAPTMEALTNMISNGQTTTSK